MRVDLDEDCCNRSNLFPVAKPIYVSFRRECPSHVCIV